jgi:NitT/TauT family transport system ATP-binding protein
MKVVIENVSKKFKRPDVGEISILENINFTIEEGEFVCLLGPSGCGKSTLLNIIAGLDSSDSGQVIVDGNPVKKPGADRVVIFQEAALFPWLTVLENVEFGLKMKHISKDERRSRALEYIKIVHLGRFVNAYPHELSGGMKQRASIARALVMDPKMLLMDEPFGALDAQTRNLLEVELQEIWSKTHKTIFFVTHNLREAVCLGDKVYVISARPGHIKHVYKIDASRPRKEGDPNLICLQDKIMDCLREEIEKVVKQEIDLDYVLSKDGILCPVDRNLGSNI